ncbi:MAG TPA: STAS domain-containing protein [Actinoplanes sp.]|nr:STAS domain-containing protein [Actinoplanes sp.]
MTVDCTTQNDGGRLIARLSGTLCRPDVSQTRSLLLKCLAEQPSALFVDLTGLVVSDPLALHVFTAVVRQAARWPGTPVLLCGPQPQTARLLDSAAYRRLQIFASLDAARDHLRRGGHGLATISEDLLPVSGAARQSRNVATDACLRWELPDLVAPASLICSELVSNAVDHAGTMMMLRLSLGNGYLLVAVRDGSPAEPVLAARLPTASRGRGLHLVSAVAHRWGFLPAHDGKVVWASLLIPKP